MDTRKLFTALAFSLVSATCFAQQAHPELVPPLPANYEAPAAATDVWNDISISKNEEGARVISWRIEGAQPLEFLLQASTDSKTYRAIKRIKATEETNYEATDDSANNWRHFRVICIDVTGAFFYSPVVHLK